MASKGAGDGEHAGHRRDTGQRRRRHHGTQHVRWPPRPLESAAALERLVGRRSSLSLPGVRSHAPPAGAAGLERGDDVPLRDRRDRVGVGAGASGCGRPRHLTRGRCQRRAAIPGGGPRRRDVASRRTDSPRTRRAAVRRRPRRSARADVGEVGAGGWRGAPQARSP